MLHHPGGKEMGDTAELGDKEHKINVLPEVTK
jgi:hypothetical protein